MHMHKVEWHEMGMHIRHWIHDPRLWVAIAAIIAFGLILLTAWLSELGPVSPNRPVSPMYPYFLY